MKVEELKSMMVCDQSAHPVREDGACWASSQVQSQATENGISIRWLKEVTFAFLVILFLAALVIWQQEQKLGLSYLAGEQFRRLQDVLTHHAPNPWRYRIFSEYTVSALIHTLSYLHCSQPVVYGFLLFRFIQDCAVFLAAYLYYRKLGLGTHTGFTALVILAFCMLNAFDNSDLSFNTLGDVFFYLLAGWLVLRRSSFWLLPLMALAALNRETSALIPFLPLAALLTKPRSAWRLRSRESLIALLCAAIFVAVFVGLRALLGMPTGNWQGTWGNHQGISTLLMNLTNSRNSLLMLSMTFSALPLIVLFRWNWLPRMLQMFAVLVVPIWMLVHLMTVYANETRIFLVPISLVLIPAVFSERSRFESAIQQGAF